MEEVNVGGFGWPCEVEEEEKKSFCGLSGEGK